MPTTRIGVDLDQTLYALDSTTIDLCLSLFPWAMIGQKAAVKMHTLLDARQYRRSSALLEAKCTTSTSSRDRPGGRRVLRHGSGLRRFRTPLRVHSLLVVLRRANQEEHLAPTALLGPVDKSTGLRSDQTVILAAIESAQAYPDPLRRVSYFDARTNKRLKFLTNNFALPALDHRPHLQVALAD